ncbi:MAG TPA: barstar family protein [Mycobacteriales bacterium]
MRAPKPGLRVTRAERPRVPGATARTVDGPRTKRELLDAIAEALEFPGWTGRNWDALADALRDLSWLPPGAYALIWRHPDRLDPGDHATAVDVLSRAADESAGTDRPLTVLLAPGR